MWYQYDIAGHRIRVNVPFALTVSRESLNFLRGPEGRGGEIPGCWTATLRPMEALPPVPADGVWQGDTCFGREETFRCLLRGKEPYARITRSPGERLIRCDYRRGMEKELCYSRNICDLLELETLLLDWGGLLLHASFIRMKNGQGLLFSAPSGTGKSTQAELWERLEGADILNGDRAGLLRENDGWHAWGLPYAGSSGVYRNEGAPLTAIVLLRQAPENRVRRVSIPEAFTGLYPEFTVHRWDVRFVERATDAILSLLGDVPVFLLECRPDGGAVAALKSALEREGESVQ